MFINISKEKVKAYVSISSILLSALLILLQAQFLTSFTLSESLLLISSSAYLGSKYISGRIIEKYQSSNYLPSKRIRKLHDVLVSLAIKILAPLFYHTSIASLILLLVKMLPQEFSGAIASLILYLNETLNANSLNKFLVSLPLLIIGILVLLDYLKYDRFKKSKRIIDMLSMPLKVVAILILFIHVDQGVRNKGFALNIEGIEPHVTQGSFSNIENKDLSRSAIDKFVNELFIDFEDSQSPEKADDKTLLNQDNLDRFFVKLELLKPSYFKYEQHAYEK
ncbi:MAG: hypothetical protein AAGA64_11150, partial [Bacteroidota bacterium]